MSEPLRPHNYLKLQLKLPLNEDLFVLNDEERGRLDRSKLGDVEPDDDYLFILDESKLDEQYLGAPGDDPGTEWTDVLGYVQSMSIKRGAKKTEVGSELEVGTFNITFRGADLDPHQNSMIVPGRQVRLMTVDDEPVFMGRILRATTTYGRDNEVRVTLNVVDAVAKLANLQHYGGDEEQFPQRVDSLLAPQGLRYFVNGGSTWLAEHAREGNLVTHLQMAVNTEEGWFYVDRAGSIYIGGNGTQPTSTGALLFASKEMPGALYYTELDYTYDTANVVNELSINNHGVSEGAGVTISYLYADNESATTWGASSASIETNYLDEGEIDPLAARLFDSFSAPTNTVNSLTFNASDNMDIAAQLDPYQVVTVQFENDRFEEVESYTILGVEHQISRDRWMTTLSLGKYEGP